MPAAQPEKLTTDTTKEHRKTVLLYIITRQLKNQDNIKIIRRIKMNSSILFISLIAILFAIIHEEKLIALEDWIADRIGFIAAKIFIFCKNLKRG